MLYEYTQYQKYGYLEFVNFGTYSKNKWAGVYGDAFDSSPEYQEDKNVIQVVGDDYLQNQTVQEFIQYYTGKGYSIVRLDPIRYSTGAKQLKPGGTGYLLAVKDSEHDRHDYQDDDTGYQSENERSQQTGDESDQRCGIGEIETFLLCHFVHPPMPMMGYRCSV